MRKEQKLVFFLFFITFLFLTGCCQSETGNIHEEESDVVNEQLPAETVENELIDEKETQELNQRVKVACEQNAAYKIFYGEWKYTDIVSQHFRLGGDEGYETMLGKSISCFPDKYITEKAMIENPSYLISIFPIEEGYNQFFLDQIGMEDLLPDAHFFVFVQVVNKPSGLESIVSMEFIVKDDSTMYAFDYNCIYELTRESYADCKKDAEYNVVNDSLSAETVDNELINEKETQELNQRVKFAYKPNDAYKIFYGTWKYTDIVSQHSHLGGDEGHEKLLGKSIAYFPEIFMTEEEIIVNPSYLISIFPIEEGYNQFFSDQIGLEELLPDAKFFVFMQVVNEPSATGQCEGVNLVIKDDNTMYAFDYNCIYELTRESYADHCKRAAEYQERY